jgi:O-antigen ligase
MFAIYKKICFAQAIPPISLQIWTTIFVLPFSICFRVPPITHWAIGVSVVIIILALWLCLLLTRQLPKTVPQTSNWLFMLALIWLSQPLFVNIAFPGSNFATSITLLLMALLAYLSIGLQKIWGTETLIKWLAWGLLIGATIQSLVGLLQLTGLASQFNGLVAYRIGRETTDIFGTIGQRNLYAHYLTWGIVASGYLAAEKQLKTFFAIPLIVFFASFVGFSGSRTALLYFLFIAIIASLWHARLRDDRSYRLWIWLCLASAITLLIQVAIAQIGGLFITQITSGIERVLNSTGYMDLGRRQTEWYKAWLTFQSYPLFGFGWCQFGAQSVILQLLPIFAHAQFNSGLFTNAHNLFLHLLAEMGLIGFLATLIGFIWIVRTYFIKPAKHASILPVSLMCITLLHSMFEYPLWNTGFLSVFMLALSLAPRIPNSKTFSLFAKKKWFAPLLSSLFAVMFMLIIGLNWIKYSELTVLNTPTANTKKNQLRIQYLKKIIEQDQLFAPYASIVLGQYITIDKTDLPTKLYYINLLAKTQPYPSVLVKKAALETLDNQSNKAIQTMQMALASFPTYAKSYLKLLPEKNPAFRKLRQMAQARYNSLPAYYKK